MRQRILALVLASTSLLGGVALVAAAAPPAHAADLDGNAENTFTARINALRAFFGVAPLSTHWVLTDKARIWSDHMAQGGCGGGICHSHLSDGITVDWSMLGENVGVGPNVDALVDAFANSLPHWENMVNPRFGWIGVGVVLSGGRMWVTEEFMDGAPPPGPAPDFGPPPPPPIDFVALLGRSSAANPHGGYYVLGAKGKVMAHDGAPDYGSPSFPFDIARDIAVMPDGNGYVVLDGWGGVYRFGSAINKLANLPNAYWQGWDIAKSIAVTPSGDGFAVLDGWGVVHASGDAPAITPAYWQGWDIARSLAISPDGNGVYVLDAWGGIHIGGSAVGRGSAGYWAGWDIARDLIVTPSNGGYAVLDAWGGIHRIGDAPAPAVSAWAQGVGGWAALSWRANGGYVVTSLYERSVLG